MKEESLKSSLSTLLDCAIPLRNLTFRTMRAQQIKPDAMLLSQILLHLLETEQFQSAESTLLPFLPLLRF